MYTAYTIRQLQDVSLRKGQTECAEYIRRHADTNFQTS